MLAQSIGQDFQRLLAKTNILLVIGQDGLINKTKLRKEVKGFKVMILLLTKTSMIQMMKTMKKVIWMILIKTKILNLHKQNKNNPNNDLQCLVSIYNTFWNSMYIFV